MLLGDVLVFATGAANVPPLGFPTQPIIIFNHETNRIDSSKKLFPTANTCGLTLTLPVISDYDTFSEVMAEGIIQSPYFGFH